MAKNTPTPIPAIATPKTDAALDAAGIVWGEKKRAARHSWTKSPPTEQDWYWHWNGDADCSPLPTSVLYSGSSGKCFVSQGQLGLSHAIDCDEYGGWWLRITTPPIPDVG